MTTDFQFSLENRVGTGAQALTALGQAGINRVGTCAVGAGQTVHLAVEDADAARTRQALEGAGVSIDQQREVVMVPLEDRPGSAAELLERVADAGVNLEFLYLGTNTQLIIGTNNPGAVRQAISG